VTTHAKVLKQIQKRVKCKILPSRLKILIYYFGVRNNVFYHSNVFFI